MPSRPTAIRAKLDGSGTIALAALTLPPVTVKPDRAETGSTVDMMDSPNFMATSRSRYGNRHP